MRRAVLLPLLWQNVEGMLRRGSSGSGTETDDTGAGKAGALCEKKDDVDISKATGATESEKAIAISKEDGKTDCPKILADSVFTPGHKVSANDEQCDKLAKLELCKDCCIATPPPTQQCLHKVDAATSHLTELCDVEAKAFACKADTAKASCTSALCCKELTKGGNCDADSADAWTAMVAFVKDKCGDPRAAVATDVPTKGLAGKFVDDVAAIKGKAGATHSECFSKLCTENFDSEGKAVYSADNSQCAANAGFTKNPALTPRNKKSADGAAPCDAKPKAGAADEFHAAMMKCCAPA